MREILFRGKTIVGDMWICGDLLHDENDEPYISLRPACTSRVSCAGVKPETVGQFTGLVDKNGTKIFEGDVLKRERFFSEDDIVVISYEDSSFGYSMLNSKHPDIVDPIDDNEFGISLHFYEIIGNVHDNPELLGNSRN